MAKKKQVRKPDHFTDPHAVGNTTIDAIWHAIQPLDEIATKMENKWGVGRLVKLVSPNTASKFGSAKAKLDKALDTSDVEAAVHRASVMIKGWNALDKEAKDAGHNPIQAEVWTVRADDGSHHTIAKSNADARAYTKQGGEGRVYSLEEVVRIIECWENENKTVTDIKDMFPGCDISNVRPLNDELPWDGD